MGGAVRVISRKSSMLAMTYQPSNACLAHRVHFPGSQASNGVMFVLKVTMEIQLGQVIAQFAPWDHSKTK